MKKLKLLIILMGMLVLSTFTVQAASLGVNLVNQDPDPALAGDIVELRIGVENLEDQATGAVKLELIPSYPFTLVPGEEAIQEIGSLASYQQDDEVRIVKYKVMVDKDATAGNYELAMSYIDDKSSTTLQKSLWVEVSSSDSAEIIYINQVELVPGKIIPLTFTINNVGSSPLRELSFKWENEEDAILPVGSDNTRYIKYLDVGEKADLTFNVVASATAEPNLYKLDLELTYEDSLTGVEKNIDSKAGVYVGGATDFDVVYSGNSDGEYSFSVANIGSVSATSVTVKIPTQNSWKSTGTNSVIIGNLNEGDYTIASFPLQKKIGEESDALQIEIVYTDSRGNRETVTKEVKLVTTNNAMTNEDGSAMTREEMISKRMGQQQQSSLELFWSNSKWLIMFIIATVIVFIFRRKYNREKLENPN